MRDTDTTAIGWIALFIVIAACLFFGGCASRAYEGLPHRPMREIDIQGHTEYGPRRPCPAAYDAPDGNLRECI